MERVRVGARRFAERHLTRRRALLVLVVAAFLLLYGRPLLSGLTSSTPAGPHSDSLHAALRHHDQALRDRDARLHTSTDRYVPYLANGHIALTYTSDSHFAIKEGRTLALPLFFHPIVQANVPDSEDATLTDYRSGIVYKYSCSPYGYDVTHSAYAHRAIPSLLVQQLRFSNPTSANIQLSLKIPRISEWSTAVKQTVRLHHGMAVHEYDVHTGMVETHQDDDLVIAVSVVSTLIQPTISLNPGTTITLNSFTVVQYGEPIPRSKYAEERDVIEKLALKDMERAIEIYVDKSSDLKTLHTGIWQQLWYTGFSISESLAVDALNGDNINATIYNVLSQVRTLEYEEGISVVRKADILRTLTYAEGCYEGHYTLQADNLWKPMENLIQINNVVGAWLLTLEKQGCHNLLKAGASGVMQAMVLSFGGLRFSNQHLEFKIHPSDLHRDFHFRRINYGNLTHVNISVVVQEDNKAALYVALDRSDKSYYACDGGCLDSPIQLGPSRKYFPVKLTDPITPVLYVTSDKQHMEDLQHAIHVKEVVLAPAHEHHVIALHRHGHSLGGLSTLFWVTICFIIVVFHLFLCRIIVTEYCDSPDKYRRLYSKP
ncbi:uncharacterized protein KIAA2013 homolog [Arctopsyche grandis]|uniref:uncharacterized protein KIAA2013 homolog n=1 Tax=Arctopsyche grandis TaxID=121162 RepID=UPI00406D6A3B